jgi:hypothetical protein
MNLNEVKQEMEYIHQILILETEGEGQAGSL